MSVFKKTAERIASGKAVATKAAARAGETVADATDDRDAQLEALKAQLEEQRRASAQRDALLAKYRKDAETAAQRASALDNELTTERISQALRDAGAKLGAHKPSELAQILRDRVQFVDGKVLSREDPSKTYEDVAREYLAENPHHVRAQIAAGSGAPPRAAATPPAPAQQAHDTRTGEGATNALRASVLALIPSRKAG